jgi:hypothetical protein
MGMSAICALAAALSYDMFRSWAWSMGTSPGFQSLTWVKTNADCTNRAQTQSPPFTVGLTCRVSTQTLVTAREGGRGYCWGQVTPSHNNPRRAAAGCQSEDRPDLRQFARRAALSDCPLVPPPQPRVDRP